jgi:hypothetical protein
MTALANASQNPTTSRRRSVEVVPRSVGFEVGSSPERLT